MDASLIILLSGMLAGFGLRLLHLNVPVDWDQGIILYQSLWYNRIGKFLVSYSEAEVSGHGKALGETDMVRSQLLGMGFTYIVLEALCGRRVWAYRLCDAVFSMVVTVFVFLLGANLFDPMSASIAAALFAIYSAMPHYWTAQANPEKYQVLFTMAGVLAMVLQIQSGNHAFGIASGILFFISMLYKQNVGVVITAALLYLLIAGGILKAAVVTCTILSLYGVLFAYYFFKGSPLYPIFQRILISPDLFFYLFHLKVESSGEKVQEATPPLWQRIRPNLVNVWRESSLIWVLAIAWVVLQAASLSLSTPFTLMAALFLGTTLAFFAVNKYFPYYYIPFLPLICLASGNLVTVILSGWPLPSAPSIVLALAAAALLMMNGRSVWRFFFRMTPFEQAAFMYAGTLYNFGASEEAGAFIRENSEETDFIYVYNLNPEVYFFAERRCPANAVYLEKFSVSCMNEEQKQAQESALQRKLREAKPRYIVMNPDAGLTIGAFEKVIGERYFREKAWHAGYHFGVKPVSLEAYRRRDVREASRLNAEAEDLFGQGLTDRAREGFIAALRLDPLHDVALSNLGVCYHHEGDDAKAFECFIKAFEANPGNRDAVLNILDLSITRENREKILSIYLQLNPHDREMQALLDETR